MAGRRRPQIGLERLATAARSGSASPFTAGGEVQASPVTGLDRTDARNRDLIPSPPVAPSSGGVYIPTFSVPGVLTPQYYAMELPNILGRNVLMPRINCHVGQSSAGASIIVTVFQSSGGEDITVTIPAEDFVADSYGANRVWLSGATLSIEVVQVGTTRAGENLVVQVVTE